MALLQKEIHSIAVEARNRKSLCASLQIVGVKKWIRSALFCTVMIVVVSLFFTTGYGQLNNQDDNTGAPVTKIEAGRIGNDSVAEPAERREGKTAVKEESEAEQKDENLKVEKKDLQEKAAETAIEKKEVKQAKEARTISKPKIETVKKRNKSNGLLHIVEGDYKYSRIPENIPVDKDSETAVEEIITSEEVLISSEPDEIAAQAEEGKEDDMLGVDNETGDTMVILILLFIVIGVIILLKVKSKYRGDNVLRRFPGS